MLRRKLPFVFLSLVLLLALSCGGLDVKRRFNESPTSTSSPAFDFGQPKGTVSPDEVRPTRVPCLESKNARVCYDLQHFSVEEGTALGSFHVYGPANASIIFYENGSVDVAYEGKVILTCSSNQTSCFASTVSFIEGQNLQYGLGFRVTRVLSTVTVHITEIEVTCHQCQRI